mmetsp:Transcript_35737/g.86016  ORF Transcript_35737/g.86016 Transcript_35737/m.86016 type:complete len:344 (-) Transcript_35737:103-1134(-)
MRWASGFITLQVSGERLMRQHVAASGQFQSNETALMETESESTVPCSDHSEYCKCKTKPMTTIKLPDGSEFPLFISPIPFEFYAPGYKVHSTLLSLMKANDMSYREIGIQCFEVLPKGRKCVCLSDKGIVDSVDRETDCLGTQKWWNPFSGTDDGGALGTMCFRDRSAVRCADPETFGTPVWFLRKDGEGKYSVAHSQWCKHFDEELAGVECPFLSKRMKCEMDKGEKNAARSECTWTLKNPPADGASEQEKLNACLAAVPHAQMDNAHGIKPPADPDAPYVCRYNTKVEKCLYRLDMENVAELAVREFGESGCCRLTNPEQAFDKEHKCQCKEIWEDTWRFD